MENDLRLRVRMLSPQQRGRLWPLVTPHQTHFYGWLRGGGRGNTLSYASLDALAEALGAKIVVVTTISSRQPS